MFASERAPPQPRDSQEIAHGFASTKTDGTFQVEFVAKPDTTVPEKDEPTFHYTVSADVTDSTGETRSGQVSVNVGYTALKANLTAADWVASVLEVDPDALTPIGVIVLWPAERKSRYEDPVRRPIFVLVRGGRLSDARGSRGERGEAGDRFVFREIIVGDPLDAPPR